MSRDERTNAPCGTQSAQRKILKPNPSPRIEVTRRTTCRGCEGTALEKIIALKPTPLADAYVGKEHLLIPQALYPLDLYLCHTCGLSQLLDVVSANDLYIDYIYETASSLGLTEHFRRYAAAVVEKLSLSTGELVVDIGSNDGTLLRAFKENGMRVLGVDPAREIAQMATANGIETLPDFFTAELAQRIRTDYGAPSLATANNIVANVDELRTFLLAVRVLLRDGGVFVFESFYLKDLVNNMVFDFIYHEHLSAFSVTSIQYLCRDLGMQLIAVSAVPTKGGSLRYFIQKPTAKISEIIPEAIATYLKDEKEFGIADPTTFARFARRIEAEKAKTLAQVNSIKGRGEPLAAYGASATSTTLMYHFELQDSFDFLVDDYDVKQGLYCPGSHIPVRPSSALIEEEIPTTLILAWRYWKDIGKRQQEYFKRGGKFLIPLPQQHVVTSIE